jgi:hypothetical protein
MRFLNTTIQDFQRPPNTSLEDSIHMPQNHNNRNRRKVSNRGPRNPDTTTAPAPVQAPQLPPVETLSPILDAFGDMHPPGTELPFSFPAPVTGGGPTRRQRTDEELVARGLEHKARFETVVKRQEERLGEAIRPVRLTPEDAADGPVTSGSGSGTLEMVKKKRAEAKSRDAAKQNTASKADGTAQFASAAPASSQPADTPSHAVDPPKAKQAPEPATQSTSLARSGAATDVLTPPQDQKPKLAPRTLQISHITPEPEASLKDVDLGDASSEESFEAIAVPTRTYETEHNGATRKWYKGFRRG